ncbi:Reticulon-1 [Liparis tanakae]|uniref:Reticulon-1 n=1 Tax=Liparis tanakae TaxID=230148 RepID=A0A4Z2J1J6_9TELE|nr:Reticulon-1 [Liparis tanakae]
MSAQPGEELGSEGRWLGDDYETNDPLGNAPARLGDRHEDRKPSGGEPSGERDQQSPSLQDDGERPPVAMETASTDDLMSGLFRTPMNDDGDVYTSLMSNQSFTSGQEASYLSDDRKPSKPSSGPPALDPFSSDPYSFSSSTKMTSDLADDMPKPLFVSDKTESYNYMDISHGDERQDQHSLVDTGSAGHDSLGSYMDRNHRGDEEEEEGSALGSHSFPYVEEPSDEELSDYRSYGNLGGTPQTASPVKITLTESHPQPAQTALPQLAPPVGVSERENVLSVGLQGVPTVTLSEPEDDSPASTPNASPTQKEFPSHDTFKADAVKSAASKSSPGAQAGRREHDGSSAESGDSEIELVSEEPPKATSNPFAQPPKSKGTSSPPNNPVDNPPAAKGGNHALTTAYSILREEREAELDSDLFIESASEESPKREQGFSDPKQGVCPPSPLVPGAALPRSTAEAAAAAAEPPIAETVKTPVKTEEDRSSKPKPPTAAVPPEVRCAPQEEVHKPTDEGRGDLGKPAAFLQAFDKQKGQS